MNVAPSKEAPLRDSIAAEGLLFMLKAGLVVTLAGKRILVQSLSRIKQMGGEVYFPYFESIER
jgi:hypothetical protein